MTHILVLGGTGTTGRRVARLLRAEGRPVLTASRRGADARLDLDDPAGWDAVLDGVEAAYLLEPDLGAAASGRLPRLVARVAQAGARRLVLLSAPSAQFEGHPLHPAEAAVRAAGVPWTILRPQWFAQNFSETFWRDDVRAGAVAVPTGDGRTPFVDAEDIAAVAAAALTDDRHAGRAYELTGPRPLSFGEAADLIGRASGRRVRHVDVGVDAYVRRSVARGVPEPAARQLAGILAALRDGSGAVVTDGVEQALGRPARPFEDFARDAAAMRSWD